MQPAATLANRWLEREAWARTQLAAHAGRTLCVAVGPLISRLDIDENGRFIASAAAPDLTLTVSPLRLPSLLAQPERWDELVKSEGDAPLASTLAGLAHTLPWFVEAEFARWLGPVVGTRIADSGRRLLAMPEYAAVRFGESLASYLRDEKQSAVRGSEARAFAEEVERLATRVDDLASRIDRLGVSAAPDRRR